MPKLRAFIAVPLAREVRQRASKLCREIDQISEGIKWVEPENMHLTLKFLGDVDQNDTYRICRSIEGAVSAFSPLNIQYRGAGAFPKPERPRTLWLGIGEGSQTLTEMHSAIEDALADLGYPRDGKRFLPHLTIGRVKKPGPWLSEVGQLIAAQAEFDAGSSVVEEVILFSSELSAGGPIYTAIGRTVLR